MRKITTLSLILTSILVTTAHTADFSVAPMEQPAKKVATITTMYAQDVRNQGMDYPVVLQQYADKDLQAAIQLEQDFFDKEGMSCHIGHDVLWDSQDPDYAQQKQFSVTDTDLVQVSLSQGSVIYYDLSCQDTSCQVTDVLFSDGASFKRYLLENCQ